MKSQVHGGCELAQKTDWGFADWITSRDGYREGDRPTSGQAPSCENTAAPSGKRFSLGRCLNGALDDRDQGLLARLNLIFFFFFFFYDNAIG